MCWGGTPGFFFIKMTAKGCKRNYLDARGHFVLRFGATGDKSLSGGNQPPPSLGKTRVHLGLNMVLGWRYGVLFVCLFVLFVFFFICGVDKE